MHRLRSLKLRLRVGAGLGWVIAALYAITIAPATAEDAKPADAKAADTKPADPKPDPKATAKPAQKAKKLTGAELYAVHCNRCHPERYPTEWNSAQWKTLMMHMRVRANLPAGQAKKILKYLQEDSGS